MKKLLAAHSQLLSRPQEYLLHPTVWVATEVVLCHAFWPLDIIGEGLDCGYA